MQRNFTVRNVARALNTVNVHVVAKKRQS